MDVESLRGTRSSWTRSTRSPIPADSKSTQSSKLREFFRREMSAAKRDGSLFRLGRGARGVYSLAIRLDVRLESAVLFRALVSVLKKLKEMGDRAYAVLMEGMRLAWTFSEAAVSWGNASAKGWRSDASYASLPGMFLVRVG